MGAVSGIDGGGIGQGGEDGAEAVHKLLPGATLEIGATDTHTEKGVTGEDDMFVGTIERETAGGVAGGVENIEMMGAESNLLARREARGERGRGMVVGHAEECGGLLGHVTGKERIGGMELGTEAEGIVEGVVAETMVEMAMGAEEMDGLEPVVTDILDDGLALGIVVSTAVDNDALTGVVAEDIGVLLKQVEGKRLDSH